MSRSHLTCRHCGFGIPADAPVCPGCRRPAIADWRARSRRSVAARRTATSPPPLHDDGYRSLLGRAEIARSALWCSSALAVATALVYGTWALRPDEPRLIVEGTTVDLDQLARPLTAVLLTLVAVTGVAFVAWAVRAYRNLPSLGIQERRYWTIWLVIGWVIPGANLFVPKLLVDDIWRASSPATAGDDGDAWQRRPVASIVNQWWCSFLLTPALVVLAAVAARGGLDDFERQAVTGGAAALAAASIVVAAVSARRLVAVVTVAQARRADAIEDRQVGEQVSLAGLLALEHTGR